MKKGKGKTQNRSRAKPKFNLEGRVRRQASLKPRSANSRAPLSDASRSSSIHRSVSRCRSRSRSRIRSRSRTPHRTYSPPAPGIPKQHSSGFRPIQQSPPPCPEIEKQHNNGFRPVQNYPPRPPGTQKQYSSGLRPVQHSPSPPPGNPEQHSSGFRPVQHSPPPHPGAQKQHSSSLRLVQHSPPAPPRNPEQHSSGFRPVQHSPPPHPGTQKQHSSGLRLDQHSPPPPPGTAGQHSSGFRPVQHSPPPHPGAQKQHSSGFRLDQHSPPPPPGTARQHSSGYRPVQHSPVSPRPPQSGANHPGTVHHSPHPCQSQSPHQSNSPPLPHETPKRSSSGFRPVQHCPPPTRRLLPSPTSTVDSPVHAVAGALPEKGKTAVAAQINMPGAEIRASNLQLAVPNRSQLRGRTMDDIAWENWSKSQLRTEEDDDVDDSLIVTQNDLKPLHVVRAPKPERDLMEHTNITYVPEGHRLNNDGQEDVHRGIVCRYVKEGSQPCTEAANLQNMSQRHPVEESIDQMPCTALQTIPRRFEAIPNSSQGETTFRTPNTNDPETRLVYVYDEEDPQKPPVLYRINRR